MVHIETTPITGHSPGNEPGSPEQGKSDAIGHNRFLLGAMFMGHLVNDWVAGAIWIIAPAIAVSLGLGPAEVGIILAVNGLAAGLTYIPAGVIADRSSNQGLLMLVTFWWVAAGYFAATLAPGFWPVTLLLAVGVMGDAFWHPVATGVLVKSMPGRRAQVLGIHAMGGSLGAEILGPLSIGLLLGFYEWQTTLQIITIPAVIMGVVFIFVAPRIPRSHGNGISLAQFRNLVGSWSTRQGIGMVIMMTSYNMALYGILTMTPVILQQRYALSPFLASAVFAGMLVSGSLCQPYIGKVSDIAGRKKFIIGTILVAAVFAFGAGYFLAFPFFLACLVGAASLLTAVRPVILAAAVEFSGKSESTTLGLVFAILDGVGALGALIAGFAGEIDLSLAFTISAVLALVAIGSAGLMQFSRGSRSS